MNFKMSAKDFEQLAKFIDKKAKGCTLTFRGDNDHKIEVHVTLPDGDVATITFQNETLNAFPKISRQRNLGEEL